MASRKGSATAMSSVRWCHGALRNKLCNKGVGQRGAKKAVQLTGNYTNSHWCVGFVAAQLLTLHGNGIKLSN